MRTSYLAAMDALRIDVLAFPTATYPPKLNGDRNTTPTGALSGIASALHWPAAVVPMGYSYESLPSGLQLLGRPWSEPILIELPTPMSRRPDTGLLRLRCGRFAIDEPMGGSALPYPLHPAVVAAVETAAPKAFRRATHRVVAPAETLARYRPLAQSIGITRLGNITGLDHIGIPVVVTVRPNSRSVSVSQGRDWICRRRRPRH
jgi:hypothetical protein